MSDDERPPESGAVAGEAQLRNVPVGAPAASGLGSVPLWVVMLVMFAVGALLVYFVRGPRSGGGSEEMKRLAGELSSLESETNARRVAMGLRPRQPLAEPVEGVAERLKKDADTLASTIEALQRSFGEYETEISAKNAELLRSEQLRQTLVAETARLQSELAKALQSAGELDALKAENQSLKTQREALGVEIARLRQELAAAGDRMGADEAADLQRRLAEAERAKAFLEERVRQLEADLNKARLFASSEGELMPAAVELFRSLRKLEGKPDSEIVTAYSGLGVSLGANVLHTLTFATGSSQLTAADQERLRALVAEVPDGDLVLAIGYASETGNPDSNRTLSSDRATAAAELFSTVKRPEQLVQAVYLGQTDRFSSRIPERNQIVEIWRIRRK
jgi:outer membrane protein OmpA-like peptidoglycan-associated protein